MTESNISIELHTPLRRVADLLCCALEGGSNYWYLIDTIREPPAYYFRSDPERVYKHLDAPLNQGGALRFTTLEADDVSGERFFWLDLPKIDAGLKVFAAKYPGHYHAFLMENEDATTGDVFLQCCLFGEVIYG